MINLEILSLVLAGSMLLTGLAILSRMRLLSLIALIRVQSVALALLALIAGISPEGGELIAIALLIFGVKGILIPQFLTRIRRSVHASERLQSYLRPTPSTLAGLAAIAAAVFAAQTIAPEGDAYLFTVVAFSLMLFGLLLLLTRTDMYGQAIGFLVMENGLYTFGLTLTHGMPLLIEIGILFDVLIVFVLLFALIRRAHVEHASTATENLRELTD